MLHDDIRIGSKFALVSMPFSLGQDPKGSLLPGGGDRPEAMKELFPLVILKSR
jgi:hypothetical protein